MINGAESHWLVQERPTRDSRQALETAHSAADVVIVGGGLSGLWTAYWLLIANPYLDVIVLEADRIGHGASGRNGGWVSAKLAGLEKQYLRSTNVSRSDVNDLRRATERSVAEILRVFASRGLDIEAANDGFVVVANLPAEAARLRQQAEVERRVDPESKTVFLERDAAREYLDVDAVQAATFNPDGAVVNPAKLVYALAEIVEGLGGRIYEHTRVEEVQPRVVKTTHGSIASDITVIATEGYGQGIGRPARQLAPIMSSMLVTEPLPESYWESVGWNDRRGICGSGHRYFYSQRTADNRIALGGRGLPYKFGSGLDDNGQIRLSTARQLHSVLRNAFDLPRDVSITNAWCGMLGVPRDWTPSVTFDEDTGIARLGGFVGQGLSATYLAAGSVADLILKRDTPRTRFPWVGRKARLWEPEPLRFIGAYTVYTLYQLADAHERRGGTKTSPFAKFADLLGGR